MSTKEQWQEHAEGVSWQGDSNASPAWTEAGVPMCSESDCSWHDGKRCGALGLRPGNICEPVVVEMARLLRSKR